MANQVIIGAFFQESTSQVRPSYFNGQYFSHWKVRIKVYVKAYNVKVWRVNKKGNYHLPAAAQPLANLEDIDSYIDEQMAVVQVNNKARNLLYNAISGEEYEKISSCDTTKEMWDKLEVTYKRTSKVKETHITMLVHDYKLFQMKEGESIEDMFTRFSKIISDLKTFGKPYSSGDQVRKILRSLPTTWQTKVVTVESQDLNKLSYDELRGELIAFKKTHLKKTNQEEKKKTVAFKATTEIADNDINDVPEALQEEIAMMSRNMDCLMRRFRNMRRGRIPPRLTRQYNKQDKNDGKCYECGRFGHIQAECLDLKRKISRGCWTDEDTSDDECKDNNENCFMARGETSEVRSYNCERCNKLQDILDLTLKETQKMMNGLKRLNKEVKDWKLKHEEHHRRNRKGKWYLDSTCSSHMIGDKNLFKEVTKIDRGSVKFGDDSKGKIICTETVPFNNNCNIIEVYLVDGLNYNLLSISQLCDSGYEVKLKKTGCAIEDETGKTILPGKSNNPPELLKESTTHTARPNEWRSEPEYSQKFIIGDPNEGMKTRGALKKKANIALISQIESKIK
ncbi:uncharacterized protein LOC142162046 [Nicotiana tabacum]|uniref:Uncharacterized protein LOC142162046 n=1 Tax=Nicotiana tabacum TaxID=4097 RepID=A0AC58RNZ8_TOBAC